MNFNKLNQSHVSLILYLYRRYIHLKLKTGYRNAHQFNDLLHLAINQNVYIYIRISNKYLQNAYHLQEDVYINANQYQ